MRDFYKFNIPVVWGNFIGIIGEEWWKYANISLNLSENVILRYFQHSLWLKIEIKILGSLVRSRLKCIKIYTAVKEISLVVSTEVFRVQFVEYF